MNDETVSELSGKLGYSFRDPDMLLQALTHRSYAHEQGEFGTAHNERLEFLGDAVLDLCVGNLLMERLPRAREGLLTKLRAELVSEPSLARLARQLKLGRYLLLGRGEARSGGRTKSSILADTYEAVLGAVFLDGGYTRADLAVRRLLAAAVESVVQQEHDQDFKGQLQELVQSRGQPIPEYRVLEDHGPDHAKVYVVGVYIDDRELGRAEGPAKKYAEVQAAHNALELLRAEDDPDSRDM